MEEGDLVIQNLLDDLNRLGFKKMLSAHFKDCLINPQFFDLSIREIIDRYGSVLEPEHLQKIKQLIDKKID